MRISPKLTVAGLLSFALAGSVLAASHAQMANEAAIKARQAHMSLYGFNMATLGGMAQGKIEYNADAAQAAASNIAALSALNQSAYWPQGSDSESSFDTAALPAIWENFSDVAAKGKALNEAAVAMEAVAGNGLEALQGAIRPLGGACGACHKTYRKPDS